MMLGKTFPPNPFGDSFFFFSGGKLAAVTPLGEGVKGNQKPSWITTASCRSSRSSAWEVFLNRRTSPGGFRTAGRVVGERLVGWMDDLKGWGMRRVLGMGLSRSKLRDVFIWWAESVPWKTPSSGIKRHWRYHPGIQRKNTRVELRWLRAFSP